MSQIVTLPLKNLRVGMYLVSDCHGETADGRRYAVEGLIESAAEIKALAEDGFTCVVVDLARSRAAPAAAGAPAAGAPAAPAKPEKPLPTRMPASARPVVRPSFQQELAKARTVYGETIGIAQRFIQDIRMGRPVDVADASTVVTGMVENILEDGNALLALTRLSDRDAYTFSHCVNVAVLSLIFGRFLGFKREQLEVVGQAAFLHDLGKATVPDAILNKPDKLTDAEFAEMKNHPRRGWEMVEGRIAEPAVLAGIVQHHERQDGQGYPDGLAGDAIHPVAQLVGLVDVYDALTSRRVYKPAMEPNKALGFLYKLRGKDFQPQLVDRFIKCLGIYPVGCLVKLTDGTMGVVCEPTADPMAPKVLRCLRADGRPTHQAYLDLTVSDHLRIVETLDPASLGIDPNTLLAENAQRR